MGASETAGLVVTGSYTGGRGSTGLFAGVQAIGAFSTIGPSGLSGSFQHVKASLNGQLLLASEASSP